MGATSKKIGTYLVEDRGCDAGAVREALRVQAELESAGHYKSTGQILVDAGSLTPEKLAAGLRRQWLDLLASSALFKSLHPELLAKIADVIEDRSLPAGELLFKQGDPGNTFWMIIAGGVRVFRTSADGVDITLATLAAGDGFGEMALLTGEPRSASVETVEPTRFLVVPKNGFDKVVGSNPELSVVFARILAERLAKGNASLATVTAAERAYQRFVAEYQAGPQFELVGSSRAIRSLVQEIDTVAKSGGPVLVQGPVGTEKRAVAWLLHRQYLPEESPFLVVDAKAVNFGRQQERENRNDSLQLELAQASTLFGHRRGAFPFAVNDRLGLLQVADGGTVFIDNIDWLTPNIQMELAAFIESRFFQSLGGGEKVGSSARVVASTTVDLSMLAATGRFGDKLSQQFAGSVLTIPPLRSRKKDLREIIDYLVDHYSRVAGKAITAIDQETYNEFMAYDWPGNVEELEVVIRRAVNLARDQQLAPEDIFIGQAPSAGRLTYNLLRLEGFRRIFNSRAYPVLPQTVTGLFFLLIFYLGFFGSQIPEANIALVLTWGLWEPLIIIASILFSRFWCGICPIGAVSSFVSRTKFSLRKAAPAFLRRHGYKVGGVGFGLIIWAEVASHMVASPRATAWLILTIFTGALLLGFIYQRRAWCRYLCPLGKLLGVFACGSVLEMRANFGICNNDCVNHACYAGIEGQGGCPMYEGPFSLRSNLNCIMCGHCIKACPNQAPRLNLRLPGQEVWTCRKPEQTVVFFVPLIMGTQLFRGLDGAGYLQPLLAVAESHWMVFALVLLGIAVGAFAFIHGAGRKVFREVDVDPSIKGGLFAYSLLLLTAAFECSYHLERFLNMAGELIPVLGRQLGYSWNVFGASAASWSVKFLQVFFIAIGLLSCLSVLKRLVRSNLADADGPLPSYSRWPVLLVGCVYAWLFIVQ